MKRCTKHQIDMYRDPKTRELFCSECRKESKADTLIIDPELFCAKRDDYMHCDHWFDGEACCACGTPAMTDEQKREQAEHVARVRDYWDARIPSRTKAQRERKDR